MKTVHVIYGDKVVSVDREEFELLMQAAGQMRDEDDYYVDVGKKRKVVEKALHITLSRLHALVLK